MKDTHREKALPNETPALAKSTNSDMVKHELQVKSYELRVTSSKLKSTS